MYRNIDECLRDVYRFGALRIEPMGNTAQVCEWVEAKGVTGGRGRLTQAEWHANAAMIQARVERLLDRFELAVVEMEYGGGRDAHNIIDVTAYIEQENNGVNLLICDALVEHYFTGRPRRVDIMDKYDLSNGMFYRQFSKVAGCLNGLLIQARFKLDANFRQCGIISEMDRLEA
ncbi:TPA: hypothetical protein ACK4AO_002144 [Neisseria gonorrhoeae]